MWIALALAAALAPVEYNDTLTQLPASWRLAGDWLSLSGDWSNEAHGLAVSGEDCRLLLDAAPELQTGSLTVTVRPTRRVKQTAWVVAAVELYQDPNRRWQLALVADPDLKTHRTELIEAYDGIWQAQSNGPTKLTGGPSGDGSWQYGTDYRLELSWTTEAITARMQPAGSAAWPWQCRYELPPETPATRLGRPSLRCDGLAVEYRDLAVQGEPVATVGGGLEAVLLSGDGPWVDERWRAAAASLRSLAGEAGYRVTEVPAEDLAARLAGGGLGLVLTPSLELLPAAAMQAVADFVAQGGDLLATGGEPFKAPLYRGEDGRWVSRDELLASVEPESTAFVPGAGERLKRSTNQPDPAPTLSPGVRGPAGQLDALRVQIPKLSGWDTLRAPDFTKSPFGPDQSLTIVRVKGTPGQAITIEWIETDGTRWIATVPLSQSWRTHVLEPTEFKFWKDGSPPERAGTQLNPQAVKSLSFGPAGGFGAKLGEAVEYTLAPLGLARSPLPGGAFRVPTLETISPWYKQFEVRRGRETVRVPILRQRGLTAAPEPEGRYCPFGKLLEPSATCYVQADGAVLWWLPSTAFSGPERAELIGRLRGLRAQVALLNAGASAVALPAGQPVELAARLVNGGSLSRPVEVRWRILSGKREVASRQATLEVLPHSRRGISPTVVPALSPGAFQVETVVLKDGVEVDRQTSPLRVFAPERPARTERRIKVQDDHFAVGGQRVFLHGVNFWPRYASGMERGRYWSHWLSPRNYDPEAVEADLAAIESLGWNLVSISCGDPGSAAPLLDFLERCREHHIWANVYIGAASQLAFRPAPMSELLTRAHLAGNDALFAYDLHWEPRMGDHDQRQRWDGEWARWLADQYGSLGAAEQTWGVGCPRDDDGKLTNPADAQMIRDGDHRVMVAAYRRFADDLISRRYGTVVRHLRSLDPDGLMGVRTGYGGTGRASVDKVFPYDLASGAIHLDFTSPEGYGLPANFAEARKTGFITAYGRYAGCGKPVFWCEFGYNLGVRGGTSESREHQRDIWQTMLQVEADSGADASAGWWWPGGWRLDEQSDYGVLSPDGTIRESAKVAAAIGRKLNDSPPVVPRVEHVITIDRDADARAISEVWARHAEEYVNAREAGQAVRVVTPGTGTTTATMPQVQVGNVPYTGIGPLKYANAEVGRIRVVWDDGERTVENGTEVIVPHQTTFRLMVELLNTGDATWLAGRSDSATGACLVRLGPAQALVPADVPRFGQVEVGPLEAHLYDKPVSLEGRLSAARVGPFGETIRLKLLPE